ncbi:MAG TPA: hypothetical protein VMX36_04680, partial [Sedimentisphaerales bacterium]|nr:hypothetical protein [Sedimentisphaerales bacterium]
FTASAEGKTNGRHVGKLVEEVPGIKMLQLLCRKHHDGICHCERSEAISNATMPFVPYGVPKTTYNAGDCHGPSGLAVTDCGDFLQSMPQSLRILVA